jgi:hypothetical protein
MDISAPKIHRIIKSAAAEKIKNRDLRSALYFSIVLEFSYLSSLSTLKRRVWDEYLAHIAVTKILRNLNIFPNYTVKRHVLG